jgi:hypothetical protein
MIARPGSRRFALVSKYLGALAFGALCAASGSVHAAPSETAAPAPLAEALTGNAKDEYAAGRILFQDKDYSGALVKFQHAFDESGDVRLLWNMAVCEKNLRHYAAVLRLLNRYRAEGDARMSEAEHQEVNEVLQTVRSLVSTVHVVVNEAGASLFVDGQPVGTTPLSAPLVVDLGKRTIRASKPGFKDQSIVQEFSGGSETTFNLTLVAEAKSGQLSVIADGGGVIHLDGRVIGEDRFRGPVSPGDHSLRVTADGKRSYAKEFSLAGGESREFHVTLESASGGIPAVVWIGASVLAAAGLGVGGYFLFRPAPAAQQADVGSLGQVPLPFRFR